MSDKIEIIVQHFHGCPNGPKLIENVKTAVKQFGDDIVYSEQIIDTPELAVTYKFRGSPTLLINGEDFEGREIPDEISLSCRFYPGGLPDVEKIKLKIKEILKEQGKK
jgi:hypothetical protein